MGLPSSGLESMYRNSIDAVSAFLERHHGGHTLVVNLSERKYDYSKFGNQVRGSSGQAPSELCVVTVYVAYVARRWLSAASPITMHRRWSWCGTCAMPSMRGWHRTSAQ